ncbi:hypothetical protein HCN44_005771 [Aphidius gifuensis]|uniref:Rho guanine nucleotide exchange factor 7 n=1 Tax=Aphidius gifuensis TaxID=684658 RepID=A0A835CU56_APHGI|nr:hypothetical protein HCN44_005771 [Aphidius gifuensis]
MSKIDLPKLVTALFTFKGTNNDELCFRKGDVITITQTDDGGWWEGTLNDKTGWFPSNYVKECRSPDSSTKSSPEKTSQESPIHQRLNRDIVLKDFLESERANVAELQGLVNNFLQPLELTNVLKKEEYKQLMNNILDVLDTHQRLLNNLETTVIQGPDARVGHLFLSLAPRLKAIHINYCNGHPQTVAIMDKYRDELNDFMERSGAVTPGILVLTTGLSKPFRRLEKYAAMLQELERHTEKNHFDRGDTQRSVSVYRDIAEKCTYARKQRELALQILTSGIKNWEGEDLSTLGEILHVGPVVLAIGADRRDRYFVLFPMTLLVLSTSHRMSSFVYEGKLPLTGIDIIPMDDTDDIKNAFEINGPMIESIIVICSNREERQNWIDYLKQDQSSSSSSSSGIRRSPTTISHTSNQSNGKIHQLAQECSLSPKNKIPWSVASLRPAAPIYNLKIDGKTDVTDSSRTTRNPNERQFEDDAIILKVIEGYCMTVNARFTVNPEFTDDTTCKGKNMDSCDINRGLPENVEALKTQVMDLQSQMIQLTRQLEEEKQSRLQLTGTVDMLVKRRFNGIDGLVP